jgi:hypothetical protein
LMKKVPSFFVILEHAATPQAEYSLFLVNNHLPLPKTTIQSFCASLNNVANNPKAEKSRSTNLKGLFARTIEADNTLVF